MKRTYEVKLRMETERQSVDVVERHLERVRQVAEQKGFQVSELHVRSVEDGEHRQLVGGGARG